MDTTDFTNQQEQEEIKEQQANDWQATLEDHDLDDASLNRNKNTKEVPWIEDNMPHAGIALGYSKIDYEPQEELDRQSNASSYQAFRGY